MSSSYSVVIGSIYWSSPALVIIFSELKITLWVNWSILIAAVVCCGLIFYKVIIFRYILFTFDFLCLFFYTVGLKVYFIIYSYCCNTYVSGIIKSVFEPQLICFINNKYLSFLCFLESSLRLIINDCLGPFARFKLHLFKINMKLILFDGSRHSASLWGA